MNSLLGTIRGNAILLLLVLVVAAVTGLNQYVTDTTCREYREAGDYNIQQLAEIKKLHNIQCLYAEAARANHDLVAVVKSEAARADRAEALFEELTHRYVEQNKTMREAGIAIYSLRQMVQVLALHIEKCHALLKKHGVEPPRIEVPANEDERPTELKLTPTPVDKEA